MSYSADGSPTPDTPSGSSPTFATTNERVVLKVDDRVDAIKPDVNVPYLQLSALRGTRSLAKTVYRLDTAGGQPPKSVRFGDSSPELTTVYRRWSDTDRPLCRYVLFYQVKRMSTIGLKLAERAVMRSMHPLDPSPALHLLHVAEPRLRRD